MQEKIEQILSKNELLQHYRPRLCSTDADRVKQVVAIISTYATPESKEKVIQEMELELMKQGFPAGNFVKAVDLYNKELEALLYSAKV